MMASATGSEGVLPAPMIRPASRGDGDALAGTGGALGDQDAIPGRGRGKSSKGEKPKKEPKPKAAPNPIPKVSAKIKDATTKQLEVNCWRKRIANVPVSEVSLGLNSQLRLSSQNLLQLSFK